MSKHTTQALQAAFAAMRCRPAFRNWPQDFTQVMADPVRARLIGLEATGIALAKRTQPANQQRPMPTWHRTSGRQPTVQPNLFDQKRAASGDRDDQ